MIVRKKTYLPLVEIIRGEPFSLRVNESAFLQGKQLILQVLEMLDSRYPTNFVCIWMGHALVTIRVVSAQGLIHKTTLCLNAYDYDYDYDYEGMNNVTKFFFGEELYALELKKPTALSLNY